MQMFDMVVWCHKVNKLELGLLTRSFRSSVFCGREELPLVQTSTFLTFTCTRTYITRWRKGKKREKIIRLLNLVAGILFWTEHLPTRPQSTGTLKLCAWVSTKFYFMEQWDTLFPLSLLATQLYAWCVWSFLLSSLDEGGLFWFIQQDWK